MSEKFPEPYFDFKELFANEKRGKDFQIISVSRPSPVLILAPHGGYIEFWTTEIASHLAGDTYSFYSFKGIKSKGNTRMHISSNRYNEPVAVSMAAKASKVITVHGMADTKREWVVVGGRDLELRNRIITALSARGIDAESGEKYPTLAGTRETNICNQGMTKKGVQVEISMALRNRIMHEPRLLNNVKSAIDSAIHTS